MIITPAIAQQLGLTPTQVVELNKFLAFINVKSVSELLTVMNPVNGHIPFEDGDGNLKKVPINIFYQLIGGMAKPISPTDPAPTVAGWYKPKVYSAAPGTNYPNCGNLKAVQGFDTLFYFDGNSWVDIANKYDINSIVSVVKTSSVGNIDTYTMTFTNGSTFSYEVRNGGGVSNSFDEENETEASSMNATANYITNRFGVEIVDPDNPTIIIDQSDASANNQFLRLDNTVGVISTANNNYVVKDIDVANALDMVVSGYILKDGQIGSVGILGIKANGSITDLTASFADYQLLNNQLFNISDYEKISSNMAGGFEIKIEFPSVYIPKISDYFIQKKGIGEIKERRENRYISTYKGTTVLNLSWETTDFIRTELGDEIEVEAFGRTEAPKYAIFDVNKKFVKYGDFPNANNIPVKFTYTADREGYIIVGNYKELGNMTVYLNKVELGEKFEEINQKLPFTATKKIDFTTPTSLANAKFFEPYLDGDVMKIKRPLTVKDKIVLNDEPKIVQNRFIGEHSFIEFKGKILVYHSEAYEKTAGNVIGFISVAQLDEQTEDYNYLQKVIYEGVSGVAENFNVHRSHAFVKDNQVYILATVENSSVSEIWMFKSSDGLNFTKVKVISNSGFGYNRYGNLWLVTEQIDGYYYFFYEGLAPGTSIWSVKIARSTTLEGDYSFYQNVTGAGSGGAVGGICVIYYANKFRMFYHYAPSSGNLPTYLGYAESPKATPGSFTVINQPFLALDNSPIGVGTDQNGDFALLEINGSIWAGYQYAINTPILNGVFCYKKLNGLTYENLFI